MAPEVGQVLHQRYRVEEILGSGAEGSVYLCTDVRVGDQPRAVKRIAEDTPQVRATATLMAGLRHPNMPLFMDHFAQDGSYYLVMEYVQGEPLDHYVESRGPLSELEACKLGLAVTRALDYLHRQEVPILFRDLKPSNIVLTSAEELKLVDFGLATINQGRLEEAGSVGYAAPEQWDADQPESARTDLFGLGKTLEYLATGKHPHPDPRRAADLPDFSPAFQSLIADLTRFEPSARPSDAGEVSARLAGCLEIVAPRKRKASLLGTLVRRRELLTLLLATFFYLAGHLSMIELAPRDTLARAQFFIDRGRYQEAASLLSDWVIFHPEDALAHALRQNALVHLTGQPTRTLPILIPLSGGQSHMGRQLLAGAVLAQEHWNQTHPELFLLRPLDNRADPGRTLDLLDELAPDPEIVAVLGPMSSQTALEIAPKLRDSKLVMLSPTASDPRVFEASSYLFSGSDTNAPRIAAIVKYARAEGKERLGIYYDPKVTLSVSMHNIIRLLWEESGGTVVGQATNPEEFSKLGPSDLIFLSTYQAVELAELAHQLRQHGFQQQLASQSIVWDEDLFLEYPDDVEGLLLSTYFNPFSEDTRVKEFIELYERTFRAETPTHLVANAYDTASLLMTELSGGKDRDRVRDSLDQLGRELPPYDGINGLFAPGKGLEARHVHLVRVENGRYVMKR